MHSNSAELGNMGIRVVISVIQHFPFLLSRIFIDSSSGLNRKANACIGSKSKYAELKIILNGGKITQLG